MKSIFLFVLVCFTSSMASNDVAAVLFKIPLSDYFTKSHDPLENVAFRGLIETGVMHSPEKFMGDSEMGLFGSVVHIRDTRVFVGAPDYDSGYGKIVAYDIDTFEVVWELLGEPQERLGDKFSVSGDGTRIAVGRGNTVVVYSIEVVGIHYVVDRPVPVAFGSALFVTLSSDGTRIAVTDPYDEDETGRVTIWLFDDEILRWVVEDELVGDVPRARYGDITSFSDSGNRLAIGASNQSVDPLFRNGLVRVVQRSLSGEWAPVGQDLTGDIDLGQLGTSVALSGDGNTLVTRAENSHGLGKRQGFVAVYRQDGNRDGDWYQVGATIYGEKDLDRIGRSVTANFDGNRIAASSYFHNSQRGQVQIFDLSNDKEWERVAELEGEHVMDRMGHGRSSLSLSLAGDRVAVGVTQATNAEGIQVGSVWILHLALPAPLSVLVSSGTPSMPPTLTPSILSSVSLTTETSSLPTVASSDSPSLRASSSPSPNTSSSPSIAPTISATYVPSADRLGYTIVKVDSIDSAILSAASYNTLIFSAFSSTAVLLMI